MQYLGGKSRIANSIAKVINENDCKVFVSLFCGSCAVETKVKASKKILNDKHPYLIYMWRALQNGWEPPDTITKEQYYKIKENIAYSPTLAGLLDLDVALAANGLADMLPIRRETIIALGQRKVY